MKRRLRIVTFPSNIELALKLILCSLIHEPCRIILECFNEPRQEIWRREIEREFNERTGEKFGNAYYKNVLDPYLWLLCESKLLDLIRHSYATESYELTRAGYRIAKPLSAFFNDYEQTAGFPLTKIFREKKSISDQPYFRFKILQRLVEAGGRLRKYQLVYQKETKSETSIEYLETLGLILTESIDVEIRFAYSSFKMISFSNSGLPPIAGEVARLLFIRRPRALRLREIVDISGFDTIEIEDSIALLKSKNIIKGVGKHPVDKEIYINITSEGKKFWENFCLPLIEFLRSPSRTQLPVSILQPV